MALKSLISGISCCYTAGRYFAYRERIFSVIVPVWGRFFGCHSMNCAAIMDLRANIMPGFSRYSHATRHLARIVLHLTLFVVRPATATMCGAGIPATTSISAAMPSRKSRETEYMCSTGLPAFQANVPSPSTTPRTKCGSSSGGTSGIHVSADFCGVPPRASRSVYISLLQNSATYVLDAGATFSSSIWL